MASVPAAGDVPRRATLRAHLVRLVLVAALPLAALQVWNLYDTYQADRQKADQQVFHLAQVTASETAKFLGQVQNILDGMAARPAVRALDPARCDPILKDFLALAPRFTNVITLDAAGKAVCSAVPFAPGRVPAAGAPAFLQQLSESGPFAVGPLAWGQVTGRWVVPVGRRIDGANGGFAGAVVLPIDLVALPLLPSVEGLPDGTTTGLMAADGTILARSRDADRFVGTKVGANRPAQRERTGSAHVMGIDGIERIQGFTTVPGTDWVAIVSMPADAVYAGISASTRTSALIGIAVLTLALLLANRSSRRIREPIVALSNTAGEVAGGNLAARASATGAAEIVEVATQFNRMLESRARAEAALKESEARFRSLTELSSDYYWEQDEHLRFTAREGIEYERDAIPLENVIGKKRWELPGLNMTGEDWQRHRADLDARREFRNLEILRPQVSGKPRWISLSGRPVYDDDGRFRGYRGVGQDITDRKQAEAEQLRLLTTLEASLNEIYIFDADSLRFTYVNRGALRNLGYTKEEMRTMNPLQIKIEHSEASFRELIAPLVAGKREVVAFETVHRRADGTHYPVEVHLQLVSSGGRREFLAVILDITRRQAAIAELRESERRFRSALEGVPLIATTLDPEGKITFCNDFLLALTGWQRDEVIGQNWFETFLPESVREPVWALFRHSIATGVMPGHYENPILTRSGEIREIRWRNIVLHDAQGKSAGSVGLGEDITERNLYEKALRESEARFRSLTSLTSDWYWEQDEEFRFVSLSVNAEQKSGAPIAQSIGKRRWELPDAVPLSGTWAEHRAHLEAHQPYRDFQFRRSNQAGAVLYQSVSGEPVFDASGAFRGYRGTAVDITERIRLDMALRESAKRLEILTRRLLEVQEFERRTLARELHDEVGGVLTAVKLNLQSLRGKRAGGPGAAAIADGIELVDGAIRSVRSLSLDLRPAVLDDLGLIPALKGYCERIAKSAGMPIELSLEAIDLKLAPQLESACFRIVQEAVTNALRHAKASRIRVALRRVDGSFMLEVADDGAGYDVAAARRRSLAGESSGLLGMEERVALLGGRFQIDSTPGAGTRLCAEFDVPEGGFA